MSQRVGVRASSPGSRARPETVLVTMSVVGFLLAVWPIILPLTRGQGLPLLPFLAHVCGMLAGYGVLVLVALMSRWPFLERSVGSDQLARWHSAAGRTVLTLILVHAWAATQAWANVRGESIAAALRDVLGMRGLIAATVGTIVLIVIAILSARAARRALKYETWHGLHLLAYVAVALSFLHQLAGPDLTGHRWLQVGWALAYTHVFALAVRHRFLAPLSLARRHRLRVVSIEPEAPGVVSIVVSGEHLDELRAESGQFFRWRFLTPDTWWTAHPFSLSAPPTNSTLRLTVKSLGDGSRLLQSIDIGTWVIAEGPYGAMTADRRTRPHVLLVAGGVGITPMRSLFESMPLDEDQDLLLLYKVADLESAVFREELEWIARGRGARVHYVFGGDRDSLSASGLLELVPDLLERDVYMCGPPGMSDAVRGQLALAGLPAMQLHEERFAF